MRALILRGITGSGKSTFAESLRNTSPHTVTIHSTDFFFSRSGTYCFDRIRLPLYHKLNFDAFCRSLVEQTPVVVCDNTNSRIWEYERYVDAAVRHGYGVTILSFPHPTIEEALRRTVHGVPGHAIKRMLERFEHDPRAIQYDHGDP